MGAFGPPTDDPLAARLFPPLPDTVRWGLDRMERVLASVGSPHRDAPVLHVAGSNGKGTVARIWASVLGEAGFRVGLYTSPHLVSFRERIQVDGGPLPDRVLEELADELRPWFLRFGPSYFEAATALAFLAFARSEVDVMVIEVGLGGRLDATNVVDPVLTAVTNVSLEHRDLLGDSVRAIAREKAGILKPGVPAYTAATDPDAIAVLREEALSLGVPLTRVRAPEGGWTLSGIRTEIRTRRWGLLPLEAPRLLGDHQLANLALAVRSLEALPPRLLPSARAVIAGVAAVRNPGRLQIEEAPPRRWIFDVAHNGDGMRALVTALNALSLRRPVVGIVGILRDKDWDGMIPALAGVADAILLTTPQEVPGPRRWDPEEVVERFPELDLLVLEALDDALLRAGELTLRGGTVVVTGSTYTVGAVLRRLDALPREALPALDELP